MSGHAALPPKIPGRPPLSGVVVLCLLALGDPASIEKAGFSKKSIAKMGVL